MTTRIVNDLLGRMLHAQLYDRMVKFAQQYSPESPAEPMVNNWLTGVYNNDPRLHILINYDEKYHIYDHSVIEVINVHGTNIVVCHQTQHDRVDKASFDEGNEYIKKLCVEVHASSVVIFMHKNAKAMEKRYGYKTTRYCMVWKPDEEGKEEL